MANQSKKRSNTKKNLTHQKIIVGFVSSLVTAFVLIAAVCVAAIPERNAAVREKRIDEIFSQVFTPETLDYRIECSQIIGKKTPYEGAMGDEGRTRASWWELVYGATVDETKENVKQRAEKAGFSFDREEYGYEYHFVNDNGEWLIVGFQSKPRNDEMINDLVMGGEGQASPDMDFNAAPTDLWVHINLDDDNV